MNDPVVSVVVPVYNVRDYLGECLDSLLAQTLDPIEIICVNDGSTDRSEGVIDEFAQRDNRIVRVDKANGGLSSARNAGIDAARGTYVFFVDSDDYVRPLLCERVVSEFERTGADVVTFGADAVPEGEANDWLKTVLSPRDVVYEGFSLDLLFKENSHPYSWRTALRKTFLDEYGLRFNEGVKFGEDEVFDFAAYPRSRKTALISDRLYCYRVSRSGSLMAVVGSDIAHKMRQHVQIASAILEDWESQGILRLYEAGILAWVIQFVMVDSLFLEDSEFQIVASELKEVLSRFWTEEEIEVSELLPGLKRVFSRSVFSSRMPDQRQRKKLAFIAISSLYGIHAALNDERLADLQTWGFGMRVKWKLGRMLRRGK